MKLGRVRGYNMPYLSRTECGKVLGDCHQDHAKCGECDHECKAFSSAPDIQQLGHRDIDCRHHGSSDNFDDCQQRMRLEVAGDIGDQAGQDRTTKAIGEEEDPNAVIVSQAA